MFVFIKALLGAGVIGGGVIVPVAFRQTMSSMENKESLGQLIGSVAGKVISETGKKAIEIRKNVNVQKVLKEIKDKKCQLLQNPENQNNWFDALYACEKGTDGKANFYYLGSEADTLKKASTVNYLEGQKEELAQLTLNLENKEVISWKVAFNSGWRYFKNVDLNSKCAITTKELGGNDLRCVLKDSENSQEFVYHYSIF